MSRYRSLYIFVISAFIILLSLSNVSLAGEKELEKAEALNREMVRLFEEKRYEEAIPIAVQVHIIKQKALGPEHPEVAQSLNNVGELYRYLGDSSMAEIFFKKALAIAEKSLGPNHPGVVIILKNLAGLYESQDDHEKAQAVKERYLKLEKMARAPDSAGKKASVLKSQPDTTGWLDIKTAVTLQKDKRYPYSIKLSSFRTLRNTKRAMAIYHKKNLTPYWTRVDLKERGVWYRVFTGYFDDRRKAEEFRAGYGFADSTVQKTEYTNLVGIYSSPVELEKRILTLKDLGYFPYFIKGPQGISRLYIGAFYTKEMAEAKQKELRSHGVKSQVVKR